MALFGATLITTEKDWTRLPPDWRDRVVSWPVKATFEDEAGFERFLLPQGKKGNMQLRPPAPSRQPGPA